MPKKEITDKKAPKVSVEPIPTNIISQEKEVKSFPVVGLGASAGGLQALKSFVSKIPEISGMAYVILIHMSPNQPSLMPELLQRMTPIPVNTAKDGDILLPDHVYVVPPNSDINIYKGTIQLMALILKGPTLPIDFFFRSLAKDKGPEAAGIILSGTGTDGTLGIKEIKSSEGLVLVQSDESAKYDGMPRNAVNTGLVDMILTPEEMPNKLIQYFGTLGPVERQKIAVVDDDAKSWLTKIYSLLRVKVGHDFSLYKENTIIRRVNRRMSLNQVEDYATYVRFLRENPKEAEFLFRELLIGVTHFFRDSESYETLKKNILPGVFANLPEDSNFRVWIPGCSTGEEVYSLAMVFRECLDTTSKRINLQLFGTDIDPYAVDKARKGVFPESIVADVNPERLKRFFTREHDAYSIRKDIRDCIVFSVQDILKDPPFSRLNLLCCRNLLIYLDGTAQKKLLPLFHYTLVPGGILVLGSSETIGSSTHLFKTLDNKWKIFQQKEVGANFRQPIEFPTGLPENRVADLQIPITLEKKRSFDNYVKTMVLNHFSPPAVLIDRKGNILHVQGRTGKYLEPAVGPPSQNILDMAREGLRIELSSSLREAITLGRNVTRKEVYVRTNGDVQPINLHVYPGLTPKETAGNYLVVFENIAATSEKQKLPTNSKNDPVDPTNERILLLENELQISRESHQTTIEELESSNEELKSTNEELQSSNEELQSTNEEMESSKEELQSLNEELQTVNAELQSKVDLLSTAQDDMQNLLNSTEIATIFVDNDQCVKRFTEKATRIISLIQTDIGRPLHQLATNLTYENLNEDLETVLKKLIPKEAEVQSKDDKYYNMQIIPYRTTDNRINGAVLTFSSIDELKRSKKVLNEANVQMELSWSIVRNVFDMSQNPMTVIDPEGKIIIANTAFSELSGIAPDSLNTCDLFDEGKGFLKQTGIKTALITQKEFRKKAIELEGPKGKKTYDIKGQVIHQKISGPCQMLLIFEEAGKRGDKDA